MKPLSEIIQQVIMQRTGYKVDDDGKIISGCGECSHNLEGAGIMALAPSHYCNLTVQKKLILDPFNIPVWCPLRVADRKQPL